MRDRSSSIGCRLVIVCVLTGCGDSTVLGGGTPDDDVPAADRPGVDATMSDITETSDVTETIDVVAAPDTSGPMDVIAPPDVIVAPDATAPRDVTAPPDVSTECAVGQTRPCGMMVGTCTVGAQSCVGGRWGTCSARGPVAEVCHDGLDNDCDGMVDDGCACPVGQTLTVDNDIAGSGYREVTDNWATWATDACRTTYRYLSHTVGDMSRRGRAIWQPTFRATGFYRVTTSYRQSTNRTNNADYYLEDDRGTRRHVDVNQQDGDGCTRVDMGVAWCRVGGACRLVLIGDDGQSDSADETTFRLERCDGTVTMSPCAGISARPAYELCGETATTCSGVFTDGSGCVAYCAAAGMVCTARYGAGPGCMRETGAIACNASNGHASDWCECARR